MMTMIPAILTPKAYLKYLESMRLIDPDIARACIGCQGHGKPMQFETRLLIDAMAMAHAVHMEEAVPLDMESMCLDPSVSLTDLTKKHSAQAEQDLYELYSSYGVALMPILSDDGDKLKTSLDNVLSGYCRKSIERDVLAVRIEPGAHLQALHNAKWRATKQSGAAWAWDFAENKAILRHAPADRALNDEALDDAVSSYLTERAACEDMLHG